MVIPVPFIYVIRVEDLRTSAFPTRNLASFLGVVGSISDMSERLIVIVNRDSRKYSVDLSSYVTMMASVALVALVTKKRKVPTLA